MLTQRREKQYWKVAHKVLRRNTWSVTNWDHYKVKTPPNNYAPNRGVHGQLTNENVLNQQGVAPFLVLKNKQNTRTCKNGNDATSRPK